MKNKRNLLIYAVAVSALCGSYVLADETLLEKKPGLIGRANPALKGLRSVVFTLVSGGDELNPALQASLRKDIAKQLSRAGISWLMPQAGVAGPVDMPVFTVAIDALRLTNSQQCIFRVQTSLAAWVCLKNDSSRCLKAELWKMASPMQAVSVGDISVAVVAEAARQTEAFTLAHSAANQARQREPASPQAVGEQARRETKSTPAEYRYVASRKSKVFHRPDCSWAKRIQPENLVGFATREDAVKTGRRPCKRCKP